MKVISNLFILLISLLNITAVMAQSDLAEQSSPDRHLQVDRYTGYKTYATIEEVNPLLVITQINFPSSVRTVYEAIEHSLQRSGYRVDWQQSAEAYKIFSELEMPRVHRKLNLMTLKDAIATLAGEVWHLLVDSVNRKLVIQLHAYAPWQAADGSGAKQMNGTLGDSQVPRQSLVAPDSNDLHPSPRAESIPLIRSTEMDSDTMGSSESVQIAEQKVPRENYSVVYSPVVKDGNGANDNAFIGSAEHTAPTNFITAGNLIEDSGAQNTHQVQYIPQGIKPDVLQLSDLDEQKPNPPDSSQDFWSTQPVIKAKEGIGSLDDAVIVHYSSISVKELIEILIPDGWVVHYEVSDAILKQKLVSHAESSRRSALLALFKELNLKALFYPGQAVVLVAEKEPRVFDYSNAPQFKAISKQHSEVPAEPLPNAPTSSKSQLDVETVLQNTKMIKNLMNEMEAVPK